MNRKVIHLLAVFNFVVASVIGYTSIADAGVSNWNPTGPNGEYIYTLAIDPVTPTTIYAGTTDHGVFKSTDGGANWTAINTGLTDADVRTLAITPHTPTTIYAATYSVGVFKSTDGGENWTMSNKGLPGFGAYQHQLAIDPVTPTTIYVGIPYYGVFKSTNGGENWTVIYTGGPHGVPDPSTLTIDPHPPTTIYDGTYESGVLKSTDGGNNWTAINAGLPGTDVNALAIDPDTPTTIYAGTSGGGVFKNTDGGANWTAINAGLTSLNINDLAIDPMNPSILYAGTDGKGVFKIEQETCPTPGVVSNPSPSNQAANVSMSPTLSWSGSSNTDSYDVYFGTTSDPTTLVSSSTITSFPLTGLNLNTTYYWKIVAKNSCGNSTGPVWSFSTGQPSSTYSLTVTKSGSGSGTVTSSPAGISCGSACSETFQKVTKVKLTAKADPDSIFMGWSGGGCTGTKPCQVTVDAAISITASFDKKVPHVSVSLTSLDFGSVKMGKSLKKTLKITNNGTGDLTVSIGGVGGTDFSVSGSTSITVKPNKSYNLGITFKPSSTESKTATLVLTTNDPTTVTISISLTGTGT